MRVLDASGNPVPGVPVTFAVLSGGGSVAGAARTTGAIAEQLHSPVFDRLGDDHDAIAYGGRAAEEDDASAAREGWREVLR